MLNNWLLRQKQKPTILTEFLDVERVKCHLSDVDLLKFGPKFENSALHFLICRIRLLHKIFMDREAIEKELKGNGNKCGRQP